MTGFLIIIVANVPQGLPATVISQLSIIGRRMQKHQVYIKKLDIIDELGAATLILTDKTGILTQNNMILKDLWFNQRHFHGNRVFIPFPLLLALVHGDLKTPYLRSLTPTSALQEPLPDILNVMAVCNQGCSSNRRLFHRISTMRKKESLPAPPTKRFIVVYVIEIACRRKE